MKHLYMILAGLALCGSALTGCSEDYLPGQEENTANAGTEADVPEGYVRVSFIPQGDAQTRAAVSGSSKSIYRVQAFLYQGNECIDSTMILNEKEGTAQSWPYTGGSTYQKELARGKTYTIVYLGNVPEGKLSGTDNKTTAGIAAPDDNLFKETETNMYYFFSKEFTVPTDKKSLEIPVMLRRLASRHIIGGYGIPEGIEVEGQKYEDKYYASLLDENHPLGIGKKLFSGMESEMGKSFKELLIHDIVFPNTYMLDSKYITDGSALATWWTENENSYWQYYGNDKTELEKEWNAAKKSSEWYKENVVTQEESRPKALFTLLNEIVKEDSESILNDIFNGIKEKDYKYIDNGAALSTGSYTTTRQEITDALKENLQDASLSVWGRNSQISLTVEKVPTLLDFSLNAIKSEALTIDDQAIDRVENREPNFTFLLLGTKSDSYSFASSCQISGVNTPESGFTGQALTPNVSNSYRLRPTGKLTWTGTTEQEVTVYFSYYYVIEQLVEKLNLEIKVDDWIAKEGPLYYPLIPLYGITNKVQWEIQETNGLLTTDNKGVQTCIKFSMPDFSGATAGEAEWVVESSTGNGD